MDVIESIMIRGKQGFEKYELITPIEFNIENERVINTPKNENANLSFRTSWFTFQKYDKK